MRSYITIVIMQYSFQLDNINSMINNNPDIAKPFLKWAGGKGQLLGQIDRYLPHDLKQGKINKYVEPFIGGGAVFFYVVQKYKINELYIIDINPELILAYSAIKFDVYNLINLLKDLEINYLSKSEEGKKEMFYTIRSKFNNSLKVINFDKYNSNWVERTSEIIFLNRTCFNGLFRVNSKGEFNVPFGKYKNPKICDEKNLKAVSYILQSTHIYKGDFEISESLVDEHTFVYFDPPYRPISQTASFTSYSSQGFNDEEQLRLSKFYRKLDKVGAKIMLSNSDPKNENPNDYFFENTYSGFHIVKVKASRNINCNGESRGLIDELLILNY